MHVSNSSTCIMKECLVYNAGELAIFVDDGSRMAMMECDIVNTGVGILVAGNSFFNAVMCCFKDCRENAVIVMDPLSCVEQSTVHLDQEGKVAKGSSLRIERTTFINR